MVTIPIRVEAESGPFFYDAETTRFFKSRCDFEN